MSDDAKFPGPPRLPSLVSTEPAPSEDHLALMRELRSALANVGELVTRLDSTLAKVYLAELATEHRTNVLTERADRTDERLAALEAQAAE